VWSPEHELNQRVGPSRELVQSITSLEKKFDHLVLTLSSLEGLIRRHGPDDKGTRSNTTVMQQAFTIESGAGNTSRSARTARPHLLVVVSLASFMPY
jgi:hypothetical protein